MRGRTGRVYTLRVLRVRRRAVVVVALLLLAGGVAAWLVPSRRSGRGAVPARDDDARRDVPVRLAALASTDE